jgi:hypothetical protein
MSRILLASFLILQISCQNHSENVSDNEHFTDEVTSDSLITEGLEEISEEFELLPEASFAATYESNILMCHVGMYQDVCVMVLNKHKANADHIEAVEGYYFYLKHQKNLDLKGQLDLNTNVFALNEYYKGKQSGYMEFNLTDKSENFWTTNRTNGERQQLNAKLLVTSATAESNDMVNARYENQHLVMDMSMPEGENTEMAVDNFNATFINDDYLVFEYDVIRTNYHLGGIDGLAKKTKPNQYVFKGEEGCVLTINKTGKQLIIEDEGCGYYGGANVYFSGTLNQVK